MSARPSRRIRLHERQRQWELELVSDKADEGEEDDVLRGLDWLRKGVVNTVSAIFKTTGAQLEALAQNHRRPIPDAWSVLGARDRLLTPWLPQLNRKVPVVATTMVGAGDSPGPAVRLTGLTTVPGSDTSLIFVFMPMSGFFALPESNVNITDLTSKVFVPATPEQEEDLVALEEAAHDTHREETVPGRGRYAAGSARGSTRGLRDTTGGLRDTTGILREAFGGIRGTFEGMRETAGGTAGVARLMGTIIERMVEIAELIEVSAERARATPGMTVETSRTTPDSGGGMRESAGGMTETAEGKRETSGGIRETAGGMTETAEGKRETSGGIRESTGRMKETAGGIKDTSGEMTRTAEGIGETSEEKRETSGEKRETTGEKRETSGEKRETSGGKGETSKGKRETTGGKRETSGEKRETSGGKRETTGGKRDTTARMRETSGGTRETSGMIEEKAKGTCEILDETARKTRETAEIMQEIVRRMCDTTGMEETSQSTEDTGRGPRASPPIPREPPEKTLDRAMRKREAAFKRLRHKDGFASEEEKEKFLDDLEEKYFQTEQGLQEEKEKLAEKEAQLQDLEKQQGARQEEQQGKEKALQGKEEEMTIREEEVKALKEEVKAREEELSRAAERQEATEARQKAREEEQSEKERAAEEKERQQAQREEEQQARETHLQENETKLQDKEAQLSRQLAQQEETEQRQKEVDEQQAEKEQKLEKDQKAVEEKTEQLDERETTLNSKEQELDQKEAEQTEREERIHEEQIALEQKQEQNKQHEEELAQREQTLSEETERVRQREEKAETEEHRLQEWNQQNQEKDEALKTIEQKLETCRAKLEETEEELNRRENKLDELKTTLNEKKEQLDKKEQELNDRETAMKEEHERLAKKTKELLEKEGELAKKEKGLTELKSELEQIKTGLETQEEVLRGKEKAVEEMEVKQKQWEDRNQEEEDRLRVRSQELAENEERHKQWEIRSREDKMMMEERQKALRELEAMLKDWEKRSQEEEDKLKAEEVQIKKEEEKLQARERKIEKEESRQKEWRKKLEEQDGRQKQVEKRLEQEEKRQKESRTTLRTEEEKRETEKGLEKEKNPQSTEQPLTEKESKGRSWSSGSFHGREEGEGGFWRTCSSNSRFQIRPIHEVQVADKGVGTDRIPPRAGPDHPAHRRARSLSPRLRSTSPGTKIGSDATSLASVLTEDDVIMISSYKGQNDTTIVETYDIKFLREEIFDSAKESVSTHGITKPGKGYRSTHESESFVLGVLETGLGSRSPRSSSRSSSRSPSSQRGPSSPSSTQSQISEGTQTHNPDQACPPGEGGGRIKSSLIRESGKGHMTSENTRLSEGEDHPARKSVSFLEEASDHSQSRSPSPRGKCNSPTIAFSKESQGSDFQRDIARKAAAVEDGTAQRQQTQRDSHMKAGDFKENKDTKKSSSPEKTLSTEKGISPKRLDLPSETSPRILLTERQEESVEEERTSKEQTESEKTSSREHPRSRTKRKIPRKDEEYSLERTSPTSTSEEEESSDSGGTSPDISIDCVSPEMAKRLPHWLDSTASDEGPNDIIIDVAREPVKQLSPPRPSLDAKHQEIIDEKRSSCLAAIGDDEAREAQGGEESVEKTTENQDRAGSISDTLSLTSPSILSSMKVITDETSSEMSVKAITSPKEGMMLSPRSQPSAEKPLQASPDQSTVLKSVSPPDQVSKQAASSLILRTSTSPVSSHMSPLPQELPSKTSTSPCSVKDKRTPPLSSPLPLVNKRKDKSVSRSLEPSPTKASPVQLPSKTQVTKSSAKGLRAKTDIAQKSSATPLPCPRTLKPRSQALTPSPEKKMFPARKSSPAESPLKLGKSPSRSPPKTKIDLASTLPAESSQGTGRESLSRPPPGPPPLHEKHRSPSSSPPVSTDQNMPPFITSLVQTLKEIQLDRVTSSTSSQSVSLSVPPKLSHVASPSKTAFPTSRSSASRPPCHREDRPVVLQPSPIRKTSPRALLQADSPKPAHPVSPASLSPSSRKGSSSSRQLPPESSSSPPKRLKSSSPRSPRDQKSCKFSSCVSERSVISSSLCVDKTPPRHSSRGCVKSVSPKSPTVLHRESRLAHLPSPPKKSPCISKAQMKPSSSPPLASSWRMSVTSRSPQSSLSYSSSTHSVQSKSARFSPVQSMSPLASPTKPFQLTSPSGSKLSPKQVKSKSFLRNNQPSGVPELFGESPSRAPEEPKATDVDSTKSQAKSWSLNLSVPLPTPPESSKVSPHSPSLVDTKTSTPINEQETDARFPAQNSPLQRINLSESSSAQRHISKIRALVDHFEQAYLHKASGSPVSLCARNVRHTALSSGDRTQLKFSSTPESKPSNLLSASSSPQARNAIESPTLSEEAQTSPRGPDFVSSYASQAQKSPLRKRSTDVSPSSTSLGDWTSHKDPASKVSSSCRGKSPDSRAHSAEQYSPARDRSLAEMLAAQRKKVGSPRLLHGNTEPSNVVTPSRAKVVTPIPATDPNAAVHFQSNSTDQTLSEVTVSFAVRSAPSKASISPVSTSFTSTYEPSLTNVSTGDLSSLLARQPVTGTASTSLVTSVLRTNGTGSLRNILAKQRKASQDKERIKPGATRVGLTVKTHTTELSPLRPALEKSAKFPHDHVTTSVCEKRLDREGQPPSSIVTVTQRKVTYSKKRLTEDRPHSDFSRSPPKISSVPVPASGAVHHPTAGKAQPGKPSRLVGGTSVQQRTSFSPASNRPPNAPGMGSEDSVRAKRLAKPETPMTNMPGTNSPSKSSPRSSLGLTRIMTDTQQKGTLSVERSPVTKTRFSQTRKGKDRQRDSILSPSLSPAQRSPSLSTRSSETSENRLRPRKGYSVVNRRKETETRHSGMSPVTGQYVSSKPEYKTTQMEEREALLKRRAQVKKLHQTRNDARKQVTGMAGDSDDSDFSDFLKEYQNECQRKGASPDNTHLTQKLKSGVAKSEQRDFRRQHPTPTPTSPPMKRRALDSYDDLENDGQNRLSERQLPVGSPNTCNSSPIKRPKRYEQSRFLAYPTSAPTRTSPGALRGQNELPVPLAARAPPLSAAGGAADRHVVPMAFSQQLQTYRHQQGLVGDSVEMVEDLVRPGRSREPPFEQQSPPFGEGREKRRKQGRRVSWNDNQSSSPDHLSHNQNAARNNPQLGESESGTTHENPERKTDTVDDQRVQEPENDRLLDDTNLQISLVNIVPQNDGNTVSARSLPSSGGEAEQNMKQTTSNQQRLTNASTSRIPSKMQQNGSFSRHPQSKYTVSQSFADHSKFKRNVTSTNEKREERFPTTVQFSREQRKSTEYKSIGDNNPFTFAKEEECCRQEFKQTTNPDSINMAQRQSLRKSFTLQSQNRRALVTEERHHTREYVVKKNSRAPQGHQDGEQAGRARYANIQTNNSSCASRIPRPGLKTLGMRRGNPEGLGHHAGSTKQHHPLSVTNNNNLSLCDELRNAGFSPGDIGRPAAVEHESAAEDADDEGHSVDMMLDYSEDMDQWMDMPVDPRVSQHSRSYIYDLNESANSSAALTGRDSGGDGGDDDDDEEPGSSPGDKVFFTPQVGLGEGGRKGARGGVVTRVHFTRIPDVENVGGFETQNHHGHTLMSSNHHRQDVNKSVHIGPGKLDDNCETLYFSPTLTEPADPFSAEPGPSYCTPCLPGRRHHHSKRVGCRLGNNGNKNNSGDDHPKQAPPPSGNVARRRSGEEERHQSVYDNALEACACGGGDQGEARVLDHPKPPAEETQERVDQEQVRNKTMVLRRRRSLGRTYLSRILARRHNNLQEGHSHNSSDNNCAHDLGHSSVDNDCALCVEDRTHGYASLDKNCAQYGHSSIDICAHGYSSVDKSCAQYGHSSVDNCAHGYSSLDKSCAQYGHSSVDNCAHGYSSVNKNCAHSSLAAPGERAGECQAGCCQYREVGDEGRPVDSIQSPCCDCQDTPQDPFCLCFRGAVASCHSQHMSYDDDNDDGDDDPEYDDNEYEEDEEDVGGDDCHNRCEECGCSVDFSSALTLDDRRLIPRAVTHLWQSPVSHYTVCEHPECLTLAAGHPDPETQFESCQVEDNCVGARSLPSPAEPCRSAHSYCAGRGEGDVLPASRKQEQRHYDVVRKQGQINYNVSRKQEYNFNVSRCHREELRPRANFVFKHSNLEEKERRECTERREGKPRRDERREEHAERKEGHKERKAQEEEEEKEQKEKRRMKSKEKENAVLEEGMGEGEGKKHTVTHQHHHHHPDHHQREPGQSPRSKSSPNQPTEPDAEAGLPSSPNKESHLSVTESMVQAYGYNPLTQSPFSARGYPGLAVDTSTLDHISLPFVKRKAVVFLRTDQEEFVEVGRGTYGCVYLAQATTRRGTAKVVVKDFFSDSSSWDLIVHEARMLCYLQDTGVIPHFYGLLKRRTHGDDFSLIQQYFAQGRTLHTVLVNKEQLPPELWQDVAWQLARGLLLIHEHHVLLNDLKGDNVLIDLRRERKIIKYIDLGMATYRKGLNFHLPEDQMSKFNFLSPEVRAGAYTSPMSDVYSLGYLLDQINRLAQLSVLKEVSSRCMDELPVDRPHLAHVVHVLTPDTELLPVGMAASSCHHP